MTRPTRAPIWLLAVVAVGLAGAAPAWADRLIADGESFTPTVNAHGDRVAWSHFDQARRRYELWTYASGVVSRVPVAPRREEFDVDLGPDRRGRTVAVYSRCRRGKGVDRRGCDLYMFDWQSGREARIRSVSSPSSSEYRPSIWKGRLAFVRVGDDRRRRSQSYPYLYVADLTRGRVRRLPGGTRGAYDLIVGGNSPPEYVGGPGPVALDLRGRRLAVAWEAEVRDDCDGFPVRPEFTADLQEIWLFGVRGSRRLVERVCSSFTIFSPFLGNGALYYVDGGGAYLTRLAIGSGAQTFAGLSNGGQSAAYDGRAFFYGSGHSLNGDAVYMADGLVFQTDRPPRAR